MEINKNDKMKRSFQEEILLHLTVLDVVQELLRDEIAIFPKGNACSLPELLLVLVLLEQPLLPHNVDLDGGVLDELSHLFIVLATVLHNDFSSFPV